MTTLKSWAEFYAPICQSRQLLIGNIETHYPFIRILMMHTRPGSKVLEIGVGSGGLAVPLALGMREVDGIDTDPEVIRMAGRNVETIAPEAKNHLIHRVANAFNLRQYHAARSYDVAYSHGLLEHFTDDQVIDLVDESLEVAPLVFHTVPLVGCMGEQIGNERLMTATDWFHLFSRPNESRPWFRHLNVQTMGHYYLPNPELKPTKDNPQRMTMYVMAFRRCEQGVAGMRE